MLMLLQELACARCSGGIKAEALRVSALLKKSGSSEALYSLQELVVIQPFQRMLYTLMQYRALNQ
jgi:hypothetical protein